MAIKENHQTKIKELISKGKEQGFLTYAEVNDHLPEGIVDSDQIEDIINLNENMINSQSKLGTLAAKIQNDKDLKNENIVKVITKKKNY